MATGAVSGITGQNVGATQRARGVDTLKSEDFFKLMVTELQSQDPLEPTKTQDMIGQVANIRSIEQSERLNQSLERMTSTQRLTGTSELINRFVLAEMTDSAGNLQRVEGVVAGVRFASDGTTLLDLDTGQTVRAQDVKIITSLDRVDLAGRPAA
jgi:flagellar basal-body rod modification protein FlgD